VNLSSGLQAYTTCENKCVNMLNNQCTCYEDMLPPLSHVTFSMLFVTGMFISPFNVRRQQYYYVRNRILILPRARVWNIQQYEHVASMFSVQNMLKYAPQKTWTSECEQFQQYVITILITYFLPYFDQILLHVHDYMHINHSICGMHVFNMWYAYSV